MRKRTRLRSDCKPFTVWAAAVQDQRSLYSSRFMHRTLSGTPRPGIAVTMAAPRLGEFAVLHVPPPHTHTYAPTAGAPIARCLIRWERLPAPSFQSFSQRKRARRPRYCGAPGTGVGGFFAGSGGNRHESRMKHVCTRHLGGARFDRSLIAPKCVRGGGRGVVVV